MLAGKVTPTPVVIRRAEVGGCQGDRGVAQTPLGVGPVVTHQLVASAAGLAAPEKNTTYGGCVHSESSVDCVIIPTSSS